MFGNKVVGGSQGSVIEMSFRNTEIATQKNQLNFWFSFIMSWIVIGLAIHFEKWIWIRDPKKWIEQQPADVGI
jgi:hypothetical protein